MLLRGNFKITIGGLQLVLLDSLEIVSSVDVLATTATITLPAMVYNQSLDVENKIKPGDKVRIELGYGDTLKLEFEGYLCNIATSSGKITLDCEDALYLTRKSIPNKMMLQTSIKDVARYIAQTVGLDPEVQCTYDIVYDKFVVHQTTGYKVLKQLQDEFGAHIYLQGHTLHVHPPYKYINGEAKEVYYDFARNIEAADLKYLSADKRKYEIEVEGIMDDGTRVITTTGTEGGDKRSIKVRGVHNEDELKKIGQAELDLLVYDGYEGSITTWLEPYVAPGHSAEIRDADYPYKNGRYYVAAVTTAVSVTGGGSRKVELGIKLSN